MSNSTGHRGHVLITGASTGIGRATALHLASLGFSVFAGVRRDIDGQAIDALGSESATNGGCLCAMSVDVTDIHSIRAAIEKVQSRVGDEGLLGLVNNAGVSFNGPIEHVTLDECRKQFEVNFFGQIAVIQAALPLLRRHVQRNGHWSARIVNMSSIAGKVAQPITGPYAASKFALESLSDSLRLELRPQGIHVCLVNPGAIDTPIWKKGLDAAASVPTEHPSRELYGQMIDNVVASARKNAAAASPPLVVAKAVAACLTRRRPKTRTFVGMDAKTGAISKMLLPDRWFDAALANYFSVPKPS